MKKETSSAKTPSKPKDNEKKAPAQKKADSNPETPAIAGVEVTNQTSEQMTNHAPDQLTNQSAPPVPSDGLIAEVAKPQTTSNFPIGALPSRLQEIIREAAETAKEYAREQSDERIASRIQTIEESGTQIISLNDEMHEQIRELCKPVYESIEKNVSEDLVDAYLGDMKGVIE